MRTVEDVTYIEAPPEVVWAVTEDVERWPEWTVTEFVPERRFTWETRRMGLHFRGSHHLEPRGSGTSNRLELVVAGWGGVLLWPILRRFVRDALISENQGLKTRCEAVARDRAERQNETRRS